MSDYKQKILDYISENEVFKQYYQQLSDEEKKSVDEVLSGFLTDFSLPVIKMIEDIHQENKK